MTVTSTQRSVTYTGNGSTTEFPIEFYFEVDWIVATFSTVNDSGEVLSEDVVDPGEYTLSGAGEESGGSLTYPLSGDPLSASERLTIERVVPVTQERVFSNTKPYDATQHGAALDKLTMVAQRHDDDLGRCVKVPVGEDTDPDDMMLALRQDAANAATSMSAAQAAQDDAEDARDASLVAAAAAEVAAAKVPGIEAGDADAFLSVKADESGNEYVGGADARAKLGLGTIATQDADAVALTGGSLSGVNLGVPPANLVKNSGWGLFSQGTPVGVGDELVSNGGFDTDTTDWTGTDCTLASVSGGQSGNCLQLTYTGGTFQYASQTITGLTVGRLYRISCYVKSGTSGDEVCHLFADVGAWANYTQTTTSSAWAEVVLFWRATATSTTIALRKQGATSGTMLFDSVSMQELGVHAGTSSYAAPDGWSKSYTGGTVTRMYSDGGHGSRYMLRIETTSLFYLWQLLDDYGQFIGRDNVDGLWMRSDTAGAWISIGEGALSSNSTAHSGGGDWEWLEVTRAFTSGATEARFNVVIPAGATVDIECPTWAFGSILGEGSHAPWRGEVTLDTYIDSTALDTSYSTGATTIDVGVLTEGRIGDGVRAVRLGLQARDSGSSAADVHAELGQGNGLGSGGMVIDAHRIANDVAFRAMGRVPVNDNTFQIYATASGSSTFDITYAAIRGAEV